jgi:tRNA threonylcarbamoyladenosine biosynthesis protein TsaB
MKLLALDTSTEYLSLALRLEGETVSRDIRAGQRHSELILPMLHELLASTETPLSQLDGIAFGKGPGSFTGLRIGCGVAQGLAFGADLPVTGICTLLALAEAAQGTKVLACLDARMGEIYHGAYVKMDGTWQEIHGPSLCKAEDAPDIMGTGWVGIGSGFAMYGETLATRYGEQLAHTIPDAYPHAKDIAALSVAIFKEGKGLKADYASPLYIRDKVALKVSER